MTYNSGPKWLPYIERSLVGTWAKSGACMNIHKLWEQVPKIQKQLDFYTFSSSWKGTKWVYEKDKDIETGIA